MECLTPILIFLVPLLYVPTKAVNVDTRCFPGQSCFPSDEELVNFQRTIDGSLVYPSDEVYHTAVVMKNVYTTEFPVALVAVRTIEDVQKAILFAKKYNLRVTVQSSGHDFIGRSTGHGSLQINLTLMNKTTINLNSPRNAAGVMTCESAISWLEVYQEVDKHNRVIVGGSAHTVRMGGYTLGGGHSPMSRMFGLAVDNLLEIEMVDVNGNIVIANEHFTHITYVNGSTTNTSDTDIFWAARGGGGGTFGIVTKFTFKLHYAAPGVVQFQCGFPLRSEDGSNIGFDVVRKFFDILPNMPKQWGGYFFLNIADLSGKGQGTGTFATFMNHYGEYDTSSRAYMDQLMNFHPEWQKYCFYTKRSTFLEYEATAYDAPYYENYIFGSLLQNNSLTDKLINFLIDRIFDNYQLTGILLGGSMMDVGIHDTSVHPGFRTALVSAGMSRSFDMTQGNYDSLFEAAAKVGDELDTYGDGSYPNESGPDVKNWKSEFWGSNYKRLLEIKKKWDPDNYLTCRECVWSDESGVNKPTFRTDKHLVDSQTSIGK